MEPFFPKNACPHTCKKCGLQMVLESEHLIGHTEKDAFGSWRLLYHAVVICPKRLTGWGRIFGASHCRRAFDGDWDTEVNYTDISHEGIKYNGI